MTVKSKAVASADPKHQQYHDPIGGTPSSIGPQLTDYQIERKSLIELKKIFVFGQLADTRKMPKHFGKVIKVFLYIPLLDDRNVNDQGIDANGAIGSAGNNPDGNLYAGSKDIGNMIDKFPAITENGGRKNRVGFTRIIIEGSMSKFGFFEEFTAESYDMDGDPDTRMHKNREMLRGAAEIYEDMLQIDLILGVGITRYGGEATSMDEITGEGDIPSLINYTDLMRLGITLTNKRCPIDTTIITGSLLTDTKTIKNARYLYIGSELIPLIEKMVDLFGDRAFVPTHKYGAATTLAEGEIGAIGAFRIVVVPEMTNWAGKGADATDANLGYQTTDDKYNVYPMLVVGTGSFTTIGFQTDGTSSKFTILNLNPGEGPTPADPFDEKGLMSIKWYYGTMILRPERLAVMYTVAEL